MSPPGRSATTGAACLMTGLMTVLTRSRASGACPAGICAVAICGAGACGVARCSSAGAGASACLLPFGAAAGAGPLICPRRSTGPLPGESPRAASGRPSTSCRPVTSGQPRFPLDGAGRRAVGHGPPAGPAGRLAGPGQHGGGQHGGQRHRQGPDGPAPPLRRRSRPKPAAASSPELVLPVRARRERGGLRHRAAIEMPSLARRGSRWPRRSAPRGWPQACTTRRMSWPGRPSAPRRGWRPCAGGRGGHRGRP